VNQYAENNFLGACCNVVRGIFFCLGMQEKGGGSATTRTCG
jgi:hypothetical protein